MVQDELVGFRDGQTLYAEGGVGLEAKGGSKGSGIVFIVLSGEVVAVMVGGWMFVVLLGAVFAGGLSRRRRIRGDTGPHGEFGWGPNAV